MITKKPLKDIKLAWKTAKKKAGIENFRFHDLRHTVATRLVNAGVPLPTVKKVMTHSDISTTMRYYKITIALRKKDRKFDVLNCVFII